MRISPPRLGFLLFALSFSGLSVAAGWRDASAGSPLIEVISSRELEHSALPWRIIEDGSGRLFVGDNDLEVFDGQSWRGFPVPNSYAIRALSLDDTGRLWIGAVGEVGYFDEGSLGRFTYHSLVPRLPKGEGSVSEVWDCTRIGEKIFFICRDRVLAWDGTAFQVWHYPGKNRLFPLREGKAIWFHHQETGIYQLTEAGPQLRIASVKIPETGTLGLVNDQQGPILITSFGLFRPGMPAAEFSSQELSQYIRENKLSAFARLPDGNFAIGTLNGGVVLASPAGELLRVLGLKDGLSSRTIISLGVSPTGRLWGTTPDGIFNFDLEGTVTRFGPQNGLNEKGARSFNLHGTVISALNLGGIFRLSLTGSTPTKSEFERIPQMKETYRDFLGFREGFLLARHGGIDYFDGAKVTPLFSAQGIDVFGGLPSAKLADTFFFAENFGVAQLALDRTGSWHHEVLLTLPDTVIWLAEDSSRLWLGTTTKGAFIYDQTTRQTTPVIDPATGQPFRNWATIFAAPDSLVLFADQRLFRAKLGGTALTEIHGLPRFSYLSAQLVPDRPQVAVAFKGEAVGEFKPPAGLGTLDFGAEGQARWTQWDVPGLETAGEINTLFFSKEDQRPILWVGGSESVLRIDYSRLSEQQRPDRPLIRWDDTRSSVPRTKAEFAFPFKNHQVDLRVFTADYVRSHRWLFQWRLTPGDGQWSTTTPQRAYEFSHLSEGNFRFEVRAVSPSGLTSEPAVFAFLILPPWYRSVAAYAGYAAILALGVYGFIRWRDRTIRQRNRELESLVESRTLELRKANAAKDEFLANVSHEIRNPMNGIIGLADTLKSSVFALEARHKFGLLSQCASHLSSLLDDILDVSKLQTNALSLESQPISLRDLVDSVAALTVVESERRGLPVEFAVSPKTPRHLMGDVGRLRQILLNLVGNALKFSEQGQVSVTVWSEETTATSTQLTFAVSDEGPGISAEEQARLFTRFERGSAAQGGRVPGTGLGLALCRALAEKMGGRLWVDSKPGEGSCFYFRAPFPLSAGAVAPAIAPLDHRPAGSIGLALVADDEEYNRVAAADLLSAFGYTVQTAIDGPAALARAATVEFDLLLVDYSMPGLSGPELAAQVRQLPNRSSHATIIASTAYNTPEKRSACLAAGMNGFLVKPLTRERLAQALGAVAGEAPRAVGSADDATDSRDPLDALRLLAAKKKVPAAEMLAGFLSQLSVQLQRLATALERQETAAACHYAHLLCGRCAFINESELENILRRTEAAAATGRWEDARKEGSAAGLEFALVQARLVAANPDDQRG